MSQIENKRSDELLEILAGKALGEMTPEESNRLSAIDPEVYADDLYELEITAATLHATYFPATQEAMPLSLQQRILQQAFAWEGPWNGSAKRVQPNAVTGNIPFREWTAWLALAASLLIVIGLSSTRGVKPDLQQSRSKLRSSLLQESPDVVQVAWQPGKTPFPAVVRGDVVWSNSKQNGFMRFVGIPKNDPTKEQYQLWIIDPSRDAEPIDGGVFDVTDAEEQLIPIQAKLQVVKPVAFAVTIEKPGGVVVSDQERLPLLAPLP